MIARTYSEHCCLKIFHVDFIPASYTMDSWCDPRPVYQLTEFVRSFVLFDPSVFNTDAVVHIVSHVEGRTEIEDIWKQGAEENSWT
jgi:hypothetical protein